MSRAENCTGIEGGNKSGTQSIASNVATAQSKYGQLT